MTRTRAMFIRPWPGSSTLGWRPLAALEPHARRPERLQQALEAVLSGPGAPGVAALLLDPRTHANLWVMSVHDGGPCLACWGLDVDGAIVSLVSDFFTDDHSARPRRLS